ncbi:UvrD-helicase domain-containing protein, partial [candidate division KSB1 bacterium]|nr:UvrD-helicase domain-containing protein [candidate division KSB1 bacterium]NIR69022.1 UvrD-helicase domain-containing protein [candidate division KSB1 bacterium]NIS24094.1 UvrD-helicase domain-containing protein [candidate division KSB1 bacterium]NIT71013.1 UvrD-helicase domain-containing protein [candidate division KSB1 bacterium]NIU24721.1 UvrD-helicase domain-containing protein [candidate division KSB1 bacterium]
MAEPQEFKHIESEISGRNLIEASAGTGKTYTITGLYLRLLLEENLEVDEILVVTFTEAATNELKERIRATLLRAKEDFLARRSDDKFLSGYIKKNQNSEKAGDTLDKAIRNFDEAAIYTIHGFCNRVLQEHAFESGGLFDTELVTEQTELLRQVVEDFWRKHLYEESRLFVSYAVSKMSPEALFDLLADKVGLLYLEIIPQATASDCSSQERHFHDSFRRLREMWPLCREKVETILRENPGLNRNQYKKSKVPTWIKAMDLYTASESANPVLFPGFEKFSTTAITQGTKKNHLPPTHPFFDQCEEHVQNHLELEQVYNERLIALKRELFDY